MNLQRGKTEVFPLSNKQHDSIGNDMVVQPREDKIVLPEELLNTSVNVVNMKITTKRLADWRAHM